MALDDDDPRESTVEEGNPTEGRRTMIIAGAAALLVAGVAAAFFLRSAPPPPPPPTPVEQLVMVEDPDGVLSGALVPLGPMVVNLRSAEEFAKVNLVLELYELEAPPSIAYRIPMLRDSAISVISRHTAEEILGSDGRETLKGELLAAFNEGASEAEKVVDLYFLEFVVQ